MAVCNPYAIGKHVMQVTVQAPGEEMHGDGIELVVVVVYSVWVTEVWDCCCIKLLVVLIFSV